ncbi:MAG TPA: hypothetical protein DIS90_04135 [Cytophagales bacterium]|nr:hypothetical protein [Cytophagales bacterium]
MKNLLNSTFKYLQFAIIGVALLNLSSCESNDPQKEDTPELITKVTLTFTPAGGGDVVIATASDPDGEGVQDIKVDGAINLKSGTTYSLTLSLINELAEKNSAEYDITEEVEEEGDEHMFFYAWTGNVFSDPTGDGNVDKRSDAVNYQDEDVNALPIGIVTSWTTGSAAAGKFRVILKHQPDLKTTVSDVEVGETDLDVEFDINVN